MRQGWRTSIVALSIGAVVMPSAWGEEAGLELNQAVQMAQSRDPWLSGSQYTQDALEAEATAAGTLPDPMISLTAANLPTDTFDTGQEPMTQFSVGITQMFPRGDSLELMEKQKEQLGQQHPFLRQDRKAKVAATVSQLWLEAYKSQQTIALIERDMDLFEQLVDVTQVNYSSALGKARQQDVIRAQLELTRLDDRLTSLNQQMEASRQQLSEWIGDAAIAQPLAGELPELALAMPEFTQASTRLSRQEAGQALVHHPAVQALDRKIEAVKTGVDLAYQKYWPEWSVTAKYGYRADDPMGNDRAALFTAGVAFDLPIFTEKKQDKEVVAAVAKAESIKTDKSLLLRNMLAKLEKSKVQLIRLNERMSLYSNQLLPQLDEQAEASLEAYNNDDGDFAEAVRAYIDELDAKIEFLNIAVERQKLIATINYYLEGIE
ncbi:Outer membrane protein TolC [Modicisalibacter ilicicola DSM 19980]|uniref:Outer membrane protein TolC n=1 Tax=Modicisalibacter ilicicola DSM 19980 TaxID=1121942 RepID=A0A1M5DMD7_9GAMM|nr:TolC family protein [Halomonas ilicicola]SHF68044.1 Outer membrane protein TolC [Halomonas ilicicola DSM 19980]